MHHLARHHPAHTLLELLLATALTAIAVVPALKIMRRGMTVSSEIETRHLLTTFCVSKLEERLALAAASWSETTVTGSFATEGYSSLRFSVTSSDEVVSGGIPDRLMSVTAYVWEDSDADSTRDADELQVSFTAKAAKMENYQNEAG